MSSGEALTTLLAELDALVEKMTPGPWSVEVDEYDTGEHNISIPEIRRTLHDSEWADAKELPRDTANAHGIVALVNAYPRLREELAQTIETQRHMNTVLRPLVEELRKAAHQARGREIAAVAERDALRALIDKAGRHWLALDPGVAWEGAIDAAMTAACAEIARLRALVAQQREALQEYRAEHDVFSDLVPPEVCVCPTCNKARAVS